MNAINLSPAQAEVLTHVPAGPEPHARGTTKAIAQALGITTVQAAARLGALRKAGLVTRDARGLGHGVSTWARFDSTAPGLEAAQADALKAAEERVRARLDRKRKLRESWLRGGAVRFRGRDSQGGVYLRAVGVERNESGDITGGVLETNQGVSVPLTDALRLFRFVKHCRKTGTPWHTNGRRSRRTIWVGPYWVDSIDSDGSLNVGCHRINWPQVESLALRLGVATV